MNTKEIEAMKKQIELIERYMEAHKQHLLDLVDGVPYSDEIGKKVIRRHCKHLDFDLRLLTKLGEIIDDADIPTHTISDDISYAICLDADGLDSSPDDPALLVISGKTIRASLEDHTWVPTSTVEKIIKILREHEDDLSDGYAFYARGRPVDDVVRTIAEEIFVVLKDGDD